MDPITGYTRTPDDIVDLYMERRRDQTGLHQQMKHIRDVYTGDVEIPLPDMDRVSQSYVPNLLQTGIDQMAGRIASVTPQILFPTVNGNSNRKNERLAETRRRVVGGWWATDRVPTKVKTRARNLIAYSQAPSSVFYDHKLGRPTWHTRDPLTCYPSPDLIPGVVTPTDVIFAYTRSAGWCYSQGYTQVRDILQDGAPRDSLVTLLEYHDYEQDTLIAYAEVGLANIGWNHHLGGHTVLERVDNPVGCVNATVPNRLALAQSGQFDGMVGMYYMQAKLMALEVIAVEKGIFPDVYLEGRAGEVPKIVAGPFDGRTGDINVISGGTIKSENAQPGYLTQGTIDRLERAQRITAGVPAEFGGESPTNVRTGRRGDSVLSATIDFPVAEAQEVLAQALHDENIVAMKLARHYDGSASRTIYVGTGNEARSTTYISGNVFDGDVEHTVTYPISGADQNSLMIGLGQRVGLGTMSKETAAELDPYIADVELERDRVTAEALDQALLDSLQQKAAAGEIPPVVVAKMTTYIRDDKFELAEALEKATEWYTRISQPAEQTPPGVGPVDEAAAGQAMAGLTGSPIPGATPGQEDLSSLLTTLRKPAMTITPNRGVANGAM